MISHRKVVAEQYVLRNTKSGVLYKDIASVHIQQVKGSIITLRNGKEAEAVNSLGNRKAARTSKEKK
jgi:hypothetical protein